MVELAAVASINKKIKFNVVALRKILNSHGQLILNGAFAAEVCRVPVAEQPVVLNCLKELVKKRGVTGNLLDTPLRDHNQTAIWIAAARGFPRVVQYLLENGANCSLQSSGQYGLRGKVKVTVTIGDTSPLEAAINMLQKEKENRLDKRAWKNWGDCIKYLTEAVNNE